MNCEDDRYEMITEQRNLTLKLHDEVDAGLYHHSVESILAAYGIIGGAD